MYRMNSTPRVENRSTRCALLFLSLCLLVSAVPCANAAADGYCEGCDEDDLIVGQVALYAQGSPLLIKQGERQRVSMPMLLASRFPHPPII